MTLTQSDKAKEFRALHEAPGAFVIANVWDGGSARMMAGLGFAALATSSGASAGLLGRRDGRVTRDEALAQARVICDAIDLPVSAGLEKGFGDAPEIVAVQKALIARASRIALHLELLDERVFVAGHALTQHDYAHYCSWSNSLARMLVRLGLEGAAETPRSPQLSLADIIGRVEGHSAARRVTLDSD
jgi:2-methylisocitrate lyase-like PEP mutase family enzyme